MQSLPPDLRSFPLTLPNSETQNDSSAVQSRLQNVRGLIEEHDGICQDSYENANEIRTGTLEDGATEDMPYIWTMRLEEDGPAKSTADAGLVDFVNFMRDSRRTGVLKPIVVTPSL